MTMIRRVAQLYVLFLIGLWILPKFFVATVQPDEIGVRQSNLSGVAERDFGPGWVMRIPGIHKLVTLPRKYGHLHYDDEDNSLPIRTKDNNTVVIDVSVPYRIIENEAWQLILAGNHQRQVDGRQLFERLAEETTVSVLRSELAELSNADFYKTDQRLRVAEIALGRLNEKLAPLHLQAERVLIRAVKFAETYETQLQRIQLNEQKKLLDEAQERLAQEQQALDNYVQATNAQAASLEQRLIERRARVGRTYEVGVIDVGVDTATGSARRHLEQFDAEGRKALVSRAARELELDGAETLETLDDSYLLGIRNIQAETLEYGRRVRAEGDGVSARLVAEAEAMVAAVQGEFDGRINALLNSAAGRAYVAWKSAENVTFDSDLVFRSSDGVPAVLRLREFTEAFMGAR